MKPKSILLAVIWALVATSTATAFAVEERHADDRQAETVKTEKSHTPTEGSQLDFKELFGCMPMEDKTDMSQPKPASGEGKPEPVKPVPEK